MIVMIMMCVCSPTTVTGMKKSFYYFLKIIACNIDTQQAATKAAKRQRNNAGSKEASTGGLMTIIAHLIYWSRLYSTGP